MLEMADIKAPPPPNRGIAIIAEDSSANAAALAIFVKQLGFTVKSFHDGKAAWDYLSVLSGADLAALKIIFSDYMMPRMNGKELLLKVRETPAFAKLPFVFCTAVIDPAMVREVLNLTQGYLVKPASLSAVKKKIDTIFGA